MQKMMPTKTFRCIVLLAIASLCSVSSLRSSNNKYHGVGIASSAHEYGTRHLQIDDAQSTNNSDNSGSTLVIVGAVGAVLSILILIGGVCYAKRQYNSENNGTRQYMNDTLEEKEMSNIISSMEKNAAKKEKGGGKYFEP